MGRRKTGKPRGRASGFEGEKRVWLESFEEDFRTRERGAFYSDVTKAFLARYGYELSFEENVESDMENFEPPNRREGLEGDALEQEIQREEEIYVKLRQKLSNWYRWRYMGKKVHRSAIDSILRTMRYMSAGGARPRRKTNLAIYSSKYYATRLKEGFDKEWEAAKGSLAPSMRVSLCQDYVKKCWEGETPEFREALIAEANKEHDAAVQKFREQHRDAQHTPDAYHEALENIDGIGIPLADALAEHLGMHVAILMVGPVGKQRGEVCLRSLFSDTSGYQTTKMWGQFDKEGFTAMEKSITRYGRAIFTKEQCRERAILAEEVETEPAAGTTSSTTTAAGTTSSTAAGTTLGETSVPSASSTTPASTTTPPAPDLDGLLALDPADPMLRAEEWWSKDLRDAYSYLASKKWGARWAELLELVIQFEKKWDAGWAPLRATGRPEEIALWMKQHRKHGDFKVAPDFGTRMLFWWRQLGPSYRAELWGGASYGPPTKEAMSRVSWRESGAPCAWDDWARLRHGGGNGMMLVVRAVAWWGQAIVNEGEGEGLGRGLGALEADEDFQGLLEELVWAYKEMMGDNPDAPQESEEEDTVPAAKTTKQAKKGEKEKGSQKAAPRRGKRKRVEETEIEAPSAKKTAKVGPPPRPRPLTRKSAAGARDVRSEDAPAPPVAETDAPPNAGAQGTGETTAPVPAPPQVTPPPVAETDAVMTDGGGGGEIGAHSLALPHQDTPMPDVQDADARKPDEGDREPPEDPFFDPFGGDDPFAGDDMAGMTEEEKRAVAEEMRLDERADEEGEEDEEDEGED